MCLYLLHFVGYSSLIHNNNNLYFSGKYRHGDEDIIKPPPHLTCDTFPDAVNHILEHLLEPK